MAYRSALGDEYLRTHKVDAGDHLGDGVLDLNAGVHFYKVVVAALIDKELHRAGVHIADGFCDLDGITVQSVSYLLGHAPCRSKLDDLLIAALQGAVTLAEMAHIAVLIGEDLHLNVLRLDKVLLDEDIVVAERLLGLALDKLKCRDDLLGRIAQAHAAAAAACGCLEDDGEAEAYRLFQCLLAALERLLAARDYRHAAIDSDLLCRQLVAHLAEHIAGRPYEGDAVFLAGSCKVGIFRQEAVARVDSVDIAALCKIDDVGDVEVHAEGALVLADKIRLVGLGAEQAQCVFLGVHCDRVQIQVIARSENSDGYLATVGRQHLVEFDLSHCFVLSF